MDEMKNLKDQIMKTSHLLSFAILLTLLSNNLVLASENEAKTSNFSSATYDLFLGKKDIGNYNVEKIVDGSVTEYRATSTAVVNFFGKHSIEYSLVCVFENGVMQRSEVRTYKNEKPKDVILISWDGNKYEINKNGEVSYVDEAIESATIQLYFEEPVSTTKIFSESEAKFKSLTKSENEVYVLSDIGKKKGTDYTYNAAHLQNIHVNYVVTDFMVVKK